MCFSRSPHESGLERTPVRAVAGGLGVLLDSRIDSRERQGSLKHFWFPFAWKDYEQDTRHLSLVEHGAYLKLMIHYYSTGKPIDANASVLQRVCNVHAGDELRAVQSILAHFFVKTGDTYSHRRIDEELAKSNSISKKRSSAAHKKWAKRSDANADALAYTNTATSTINNKQSKSRGVRLPETFVPTEAHYQLGQELGVITDMEFQKFRDYYLGLAGSKAWKLDWDATFRNWLRNSTRFGGSHGNGPSKAEQRIIKTRQNLINALTSDEDAGSVGADLRAGDSGRGGKSLAKNV